MAVCGGMKVKGSGCSFVQDALARDVLLPAVLLVELVFFFGGVNIVGVGCSSWRGTLANDVLLPAVLLVVLFFFL